MSTLGFLAVEEQLESIHGLKAVLKGVRAALTTCERHRATRPDARAVLASLERDLEAELRGERYRLQQLRQEASCE